MTHLAREINRLMKQRSDLSALEIATRAKIDPSYLWMIRTKKRSASKDVIKTLAKLLCKTKHERAKLIAAHMMDESLGYCPRLIEIKIRRPRG
jgi:transcriptional regulator with XRE-family HTH domain